MKIFCDLDGVIVNFVKGAAKLLNLDYEQLLANWPCGEYQFYNAAKITRGELFSRLQDGGEDFWANLEPFSYTFDFINSLKKFGEVRILSQPTSHCSSASGKIRWMQKHFGIHFRDYVLTSYKEDCAKDASCILIDDYEEHIKKFRKNGGTAILFPSLHNASWAEKDVATEVVIKEIKKVI